MTRPRVKFALTIVIATFLVGCESASLAANGETARNRRAVTTADPDIPVAELALLSKPLTKPELLVEADAWQALLKAKAEEIAKAEIAVQRQNREIEKAETTPEKDAEDAKQATTETGKTAAETSHNIDENPQSAQPIERAPETIKEAKEVRKQEKVSLLEKVNALREERTLIIDRLNAVLNELESKTDKDDTETLAKIKDDRLYISSVQGIRVDVKDTTSTWIGIKGLLTSDEGGRRWVKNIGQFVGILIAAWILSRLLSRLVHRALKLTGVVSHLLEDILVGTIRWVVMIVGIIMALAALEVSIGPLLAIVDEDREDDGL